MTEIPTTPTILLTGARGQVGGQLQPLLASLGRVVATDLPELDLTSADEIRSAMRTLRPQWVVNAAAYTAVDKAESESGIAYAINRDAPALLSEEAARLGAVVIHYSTDYVFDGGKSAPYIESDTPDPLSVYGMSKLAGEQAVAASGAAHLTFRTSWVYGAEGGNFLLNILRLAGERETLSIVDDQRGAPTWSRDLAVMTVEAMRQMAARAAAERRSLAESALEYSGVYHACNAGETTWFGFAEAALAMLHAARPGQELALLLPITTAEYPTAALRPRNSRLDCGRLARQFGLRLPDWRGSLAQVMELVLKERS